MSDNCQNGSRRMGRSGRRIAGFVVVAVLAWPGASRAEDPLPPALPLPPASDASPRLPVPAGLPRYEIDARVDLTRKVVTAVERVRFTNRSEAEVSELVFHVYPRYSVKGQD